MSVPAHALHRPRTYLGILVVLLALTALTIGVAFVDLGPFGTPIAFLIAAAKATLVVLFFMHMKDAPGVLWIAGIAGFFWLGILLLLTMSDFATRGVIPVPGK
jgi:cytochrome c oxidase subunit IV